MRIDEIAHEEAVVVAPDGRIDSTTSPALDHHLSGLLNSGRHRLVIDFSGVEYISSAGLRVMLTTAKRIRAAGGALVLCGMGDAVRQVFSLAGFLPLFAIEESRSGAIERALRP